MLLHLDGSLKYLKQSEVFVSSDFTVVLNNITINSLKLYIWYIFLLTAIYKKNLSKSVTGFNQVMISNNTFKTFRDSKILVGSIYIHIDLILDFLKICYIN